jgi:predicted  nucleic acid-binding Zn-ribbon protein
MSFSRDAGEMSDLERLLELQANDTAADQLHHRRATLPELEQLIGLTSREAAAKAAMIEPQAERDALARDQRRLEDEVATVEAKIVSVDHQLYGGSITSPKEAQGFQADLESVKRRQSTLEDEILALMEQIEPLDEALAATDASISAMDDERVSVRDALAAAEAAIDHELLANGEARQSLVDAVSPDLVAEYDRIRPTAGGVVVARLQGSTCLGCHLSLAPAEVDVLRRRPADEIVTCPDCGRMLVR